MREQRKGRTQKAWPHVREGEAVQLLVVLPNSFEVGGGAAAAIISGLNVTSEIAFEVLLPAVLEGLLVVENSK